ncbi:MAG: AraC family transcriptional regulator ligand-binding domain-containing protein, partial [Paucibacter sp.]|nr:AraC family transcriptional regulator ligand-binding domain-containing protein [Roseateles sp.]
MNAALPGLSPALSAVAPANVYQLGTRCLVWEHQAVLLLEFARSRGLAPADLLEAAGFSSVPSLLSPQQLLDLLAALQAQLQAPDTAFVLGQLSLPGHAGLASHALAQARNGRQALELLAAHSARLSPLLTPRLLWHEDELLLIWTEACGVGAAQRNFVVDMQMSAVTGLCQWLGGRRLPWRYSFNRSRPRDLSQHAVFLGADLQFDCQVDAMRVPAACLDEPWPRGVADSMAAQALAQGADPGAAGRGLLAALYDHLLPRLREAPTLEQSAQAFGV